MKYNIYKYESTRRLFLFHVHAASIEEAINHVDSILTKIIPHPIILTSMQINRWRRVKCTILYNSSHEYHIIPD